MANVKVRNFTNHSKTGEDSSKISKLKSAYDLTSAFLPIRVNKFHFAVFHLTSFSFNSSYTLLEQEADKIIRVKHKIIPHVACWDFRLGQNCLKEGRLH